ncbi:MAG TPA: hypothetical protein O0X27_05380 [Methanocorpusculum sp.]|nr:hypothetical protein [Methanocorpusculum sp.]
MTAVTHIIENLTFDSDRRLIFFEDKSALVYDAVLTVREDGEKKILRLSVGDDVYFIRCSSNDTSAIRKSNKNIDRIAETYRQIRSMPPLSPEPEKPVPEKEIEKVSDWIDLAEIDIDEENGTIRVGDRTYPANSIRVILTTAFNRKALSITTPDGHYTAYSAEAKIYSGFDNGTKVNSLSWKAEAAAKRAARLQLLDALKEGRFPHVDLPSQITLNPGEQAIIMESGASMQEPQVESASDVRKPLGIFRTVGETILPNKIGAKSRETMKTVDTGVLVLTTERIVFVGPVRRVSLFLSEIQRPILDAKQMTVMNNQVPITFSDIDSESWSAALTTLLA